MEKKREVLSGVHGEGCVEEIELPVALDGIISERRERTPKKDDAFNNILILFLTMCQVLN